MKAPKSAVDYLNDGPSRSVPLSRSVPAYLQIEEQLADRIEAGEFAPGDVLPTERELTRQLGVSRMTVRAAMDRLVQRDLIVRRQGSGTFVADPKLRQDASKLRGFFEDTVGQGVTPISRLLEREEMLATRHLAGVLDVSVGESVYRIVRIRSARGMPVVLETSYFPAAVVPGLLGMDLERSSIYRLMDMEFSARPVRARQSLEVATAHGTDASFLEIPSGSSVMLVERVSWDAVGRAVEYARDLYRPDRSRFVTELTL
jgi:GntR family transcriptional regulator